MANKKKSSENKKVFLSVSILPATKKYIVGNAAAAGISASDYVDRIVDSFRVKTETKKPASK